MFYFIKRAHRRTPLKDFHDHYTMSIFEHIFREESKECAQSFSNSKRRCPPKKRSPEALYDFLGEEEVSCCLNQGPLKIWMEHSP
jgi:hypothetical protein